MWAKSQDSVHKPQILERNERRAEAEGTEVGRKGIRPSYFLDGLVTATNAHRRHDSGAEATATAVTAKIGNIENTKADSSFAM